MRKVHRIVLTVLTTGFIASSWPLPVDAQDFSAPKSWSFGTQAGALARTYEGAAFIISGNADYRLHSQFSAGALAFASSTTGLTEYAGAFTGSYHRDVGMFTFVPFVGLGVMHAEYEFSKSTGVYIPLGMTAEYRVGPSTFFETNSFRLTGTVIINLHQLRWDDGSPSDPKSLAVMLGVRI